MSEKDYKNYFNHNPDIPDQERKYINNPDFIAIQCEQDKVDVILNHVSHPYRETNSVIIIDNCAYSQDLKKSCIRTS